jgi:hypothetical protein
MYLEDLKEAKFNNKNTPTTDEINTNKKHNLSINF